MTYALGQLVQDIKEYCNQSRTCTLPPNVETSTGTEVVEEREVKVEGYTVNKHGIFDGDGEVLSQTPIVPCTVLDVEGAYSVRLIFPIPSISKRLGINLKDISENDIYGAAYPKNKVFNLFG